VQTGFIDQKRITLADILQAVQWVSPATADWLRTSTRYDMAVAILAEVAASGVVL